MTSRTVLAGVLVAVIHTPVYAQTAPAPSAEPQTENPLPPRPATVDPSGQVAPGFKYERGTPPLKDYRAPELSQPDAFEIEASKQRITALEERVEKLEGTVNKLIDTVNSLITVIHELRRTVQAQNK